MEGVAGELIWEAEAPPVTSPIKPPSTLFLSTGDTNSYPTSPTYGEFQPNPQNLQSTRIRMAGHANEITPGSPPQLNEVFGEGTAPASNYLHDEFLQMMRDHGIEHIAKESGLVQNGEIPQLKEYVASTPTKVTPPAPSKKRSGRGRKRKADLAQEEDSPPQVTPIMNPTVTQPPPPMELSVSPAEDSEGSRKRAKAQKNTDAGKAKGLRHFSLKVCQKVEQLKDTTYQAVADELVTEFCVGNDPLDQKNIRRRVYDALNVLMAVGIIFKDKKSVRWVGLPTTANREMDILENDKTQIIDRVRRKRATLSEVQTQFKAYQTLLDRNSKPEYSNLDTRILLPFIIVNTDNTTVIECEVSDDRSAYFFNFSSPFEIHDDSEILKRMAIVTPVAESPLK